MGSTDHRDRGNGSNGQANGRSVANVAWMPPPRDVRDPDEDGIDIRQVLGVLWEARRKIAAITAGVLALVVAVTLVSRMEFTMRGSLYLGDLQSKGGIFEGLAELYPTTGGEKGALGTEIEILKSRELMTEAILASGLNARIEPVGWSPPRYWRWRLDGRNLRELEGAWGELRATGTRLTTVRGGSRELDVLFTSATEFAIHEDGRRLGTGTVGKPFVSQGLELTLLAGDERAPREGNRYSLTIASIEDTLEGVLQQFSAYSPKASPGSTINVVHLSYTSAAPHQAQAFLEQLMRIYLAQNLAWKTEEAGAAEAFLTKQLEHIRASFDKAGQDLADYKKESTTIVLSEEAKSIIEQMGAFEQQRIAARLQVAALEQVRTLLAKGKAPTEAYLLGEAQDTVLATMSEGLVKAQLDYKRLSEQFTPDYPLVRDAQATLDAQLSTVRSYVTSRLARAKEQVSSLDAVIQKFEDKLKTLPDAELKLASLTQQSEVYAKLYTFLLERQQQAALTKASTISKSRILDTPILSYRESSPKLKVRVALGLALGFLLGIGFVLVRWRLATTFQSELEVRKAFQSLPLFASVPRRASSKRREGEALGPFESLAADLRSSFTEAFRLLRTNLYYSGSHDRDKIILVSSSGPGDGKTLTTLCLAGILAADGKRVLVVDGDMRKPSHHILLRQPQHPGLSAILTGEINWRETVHQVNTPFGVVSSISTGIVPPNPAELLSSSHLLPFLDDARLSFDYVLIDSPPFPLVSDALVLSHHADRLLTVIRLRSSHRRATEEHVHRLGMGHRGYGVVVNDISAGQGYGYGYGDGYGDAYQAADRAAPVRSPSKQGRFSKASDEHPD